MVLAMPAPDTTIAGLLAEWVLDRLAPERVPDLAIAGLQAGCGSAAVAALAGLQRPTRGEVEEELPRLLRELHLTRPSKLEALKRLVDTCAAQIASGAADPTAGAERIASLWQPNFAPDRHPATWLDIRPFVIAGTDAGQRRAVEGDGIVEHAAALLERNGLNTGSRLVQGQLAGQVIAACGVQEHRLDGVTTVVRLGLEFEDGLYLTFGAAPDGCLLQIGLRVLSPYDLGEHGTVQIRREGFPCDLLKPGTRVRDVRTLIDASDDLMVGATVESAGPAVHVYVRDDALLITRGLPRGIRTA
jgi:hypothetical protein